MKIKYYYLHGLGGSICSTKFLELQKEYANIECLEWKVAEDDLYISNLLIGWQNEILEAIENYDAVCIVANSTGANFALQLKELLKPNFIHLVLINPLLNCNSLCDKSIMPTYLLPFLLNFERFNGVLILIAKNDTVIDNINYLNENQYLIKNNQIIIHQMATHKFEFLNEFYKEIDSYLNQIYI